MRRWLALLLAALVPLTIASTDAHKDFPGSAAGGDTAMFDYCRNGGRGVGYDTTTATFSAVCGNYPWSSIYGGNVTSGGGKAGVWNSPTTSGGNTYKINCTANGIGTGQDGAALSVFTNLALGGGTFGGGGHSTTVFNDTDVTYVTNALRGYIIKILTGARAGQMREIISNTPTAITVGTALTGGAVADGDTYSITNPLPSACYANGEVVFANFMADAMIAHDLVRNGGEIYFPTVQGASATIYLHTGCGRKGFGPPGTTTPVFNSCPVLQGNNNDHWQRELNMALRNTKWKFEGNDPDLFNQDGSGRSGVYVVEDTGGTGTLPFFDWNDGTQYGVDNNGATWPLKVGAIGDGFANVCTPVSTTDPTCDVTQGTRTGYTVVKDGRSYTSGILNHNADIIDPKAICMENDTVGASPNQGVCRTDPRILCTVAGSGQNRTGVSTGGCLFGATEKGPCETITADLKYYSDTATNADRKQQWLLITQGEALFPENNTWAGAQGYVGRIDSVPQVACGTGATGATVSWGQDRWPIDTATIDTTSSASAAWVSEDYISPYGRVIGGTWMPNNWFGRDVGAPNGTAGVSDVGIDCLSGGTIGESDDEPVCDSKTVLSLFQVRGAGIENAVIAYGSVATGSAASWFDGSGSLQDGYINNVLATKGKRGVWSDWSQVYGDRITFEDNINPNGLGVQLFNAMSRVTNMTFRQNSVTTGTLFVTQLGKGTKFENISFEGNDAQWGQFVFQGGDMISVDRVRCVGGDMPCINLNNNNGQTISNLSIRNVRFYGTPTSAWAGGHINQSVMNSAIITTQMGTAGATGTFRNITIDDVHVEAAVSNTCAIYFDRDATAASPINTGRPQFSLTNISIDNVNAATGAKGICVANPIVQGSPGFVDATHDLGIFTEQFIPSWLNVRVNGAAIADQPYHETPAANVNSCNLAPVAGTKTGPGQFVMISDDTVAAQTCTGAGGANLTGGGAPGFRSVCKCTTGGVWAVP